jgi:hypothetical protein
MGAGADTVHEQGDVTLAGVHVMNVLHGAPSVIGWALEERYSFGMLNTALRLTGTVPDAYLDLHAHMLLAAINESALLVARSGDHATAEAA